MMRFIDFLVKAALNLAKAALKKKTEVGNDKSHSVRQLIWTIIVRWGLHFPLWLITIGGLKCLATWHFEGSAIWVIRNV